MSLRSRLFHAPTRCATSRPSHSKQETSVWALNQAQLLEGPMECGRYTGLVFRNAVPKDE